MNLNLNLSMREKVMLLVLGLLIIVLFGAKLLIIPAAESLSGDREALSKANTSVLEAKARIEQAKTAPQSLKKAYSEAISAAAPLLPPLDKPSLHLWFIDLAKKSNLTVESMSISDPAPSTPSFEGLAADNASASSNATCNMDNYANQYKNGRAASSGTEKQEIDAKAENGGPSPAGGDAMMATVKLTITGSYKGMEAFLDEINNSKRYIIISALSCNKEQDVFTFQITLQCYGAQKLDGSDNIFNWKQPNPKGKEALM